MIGEHFFGVGRGHVSAQMERRIDRIAARHGATYVQVTMPGNGRQRWFACANRGEPFDSQTRAAVFADLAAAGIDIAAIVNAGVRS